MPVPVLADTGFLITAGRQYRQIFFIILYHLNLLLRKGFKTTFSGTKNI